MDSKTSNNVWLYLCYKELCDKQKLTIGLYFSIHNKNGITVSAILWNFIQKKNFPDENTTTNWYFLC